MFLRIFLYFVIVLFFGLVFIGLVGILDGFLLYVFNSCDGVVEKFCEVVSCLKSKLNEFCLLLFGLNVNLFLIINLFLL